MYAVSESTLGSTEQVVAAVTSPLVGLADLETMVKRLLPAVPTQAPPPLSASTDLETMLKRLLPELCTNGDKSHVEMPASRNTDTGAATPSAWTGLRYCAYPVAITATG